MAGEQTLRRKTPTFRMWNAIVIVGMISLCVAEGRMADSDEKGIWVLQMFSTHSRQQCRRECKAASSPDGHTCNWSMVYRRRCLLMHCDSLHHCRDVAGLLTGFKHFTKRKKRDSKAALYLKRRMMTPEPLLNGTNGAGVSATTQTTSTKKAPVTQTWQPTTETTSTAAQPTTAASRATPESTTSQPTDPQLAVTTSQPATVTIKTILSTVHPTTIIKYTTTVPSPAPAPSSSTFSWLTTAMSATSVIGETTSSAIEKPLLTPNQTTQITQTNSTATQPPPLTITKPVAIATQLTLPTKDLTSAVVSATPEKADNSTTEELNSTAATDQINTTALQPSDGVSGTLNQVPQNETHLRTTGNPSVMSSTDQTFIAVISETTSAPEITAILQSSATIPTLTSETASTSTPLPATTTNKPAVTAEPAWPVTSSLPTKEETTISKTTAASLQRTHSSDPATLASTSSASLPSEGDSQKKVNDDDYLLATWPLARHLMDKSSLLAVLLFGIVFFLAVVFVFAAQAYESYKKKDYTQVDYLINGMYADSEL